MKIDNKFTARFFNLSNIWHVVLIFSIIGLLIYSRSLFNLFVWDDYSQIINNYYVHSIANLPKFFLGSTFAPEVSTALSSVRNINLSGIYYKPFLSLTYSIIYSLFGPNPFPYHLFQIYLHILNAILVYVFFRRFFYEKLSFFLALVFLVHPIQVEAVSYIAALQEPLFFVFGMTALILYQKDRISIKRKVCIAILLLCSLLSKEAGVLFLGATFAYFLLFKFNKSLVSINIALVVFPFTVYIVLRFFVASIYFQKLAGIPIMNASFYERLLTLPGVISFYLTTFLFPKDLVIFQTWVLTKPDHIFYISLFWVILFFIAFLLLTIFVWRKKRKNLRMLVYFSTLFALGIFLHSQIIPLDMTVADRWFYFPIVGLLGIIGVAIQIIKNPSAVLKKTGVWIAIIIILLFSIRTINRSINWYNGLSLYGNDLPIGKSDDRLKSLIAVDLIQVGKYDQAQIYLEEFLDDNPSDSHNYTNLGIIYEFKGDLENAKRFYWKAANADTTGGAYSNLARITLFNDGNAEQTLVITQKGLKQYPIHGKLWLFQALASYKLGNKEKALTEADKAVRLMPSNLTKNVFNKIEKGKPVLLKTSNNKTVIIDLGR